MANPNIVNTSSIYGTTSAVMLSASSDLAGTATAIIVSNPAGSNAVYKINALYTSNIGSSANNVSIEFNRPGSLVGGPSFYIVRNLTIPAQSTLDVLSKSVYLQENDSLRGACLSAAGNSVGIEAVCSFEIIS